MERIQTDDIDQTVCTQCETETREIYIFDTNADGLADVLWCENCGSLYVRDPSDVKASWWIPPVKRAKT